MQNVEKLAGFVRQKADKGRALRRHGKLPGIIYGADADPLPMVMATRMLEKEMHRQGFFSRAYDIEIDGKTHHVLPWDVQLHPVTDEPVHIDFLRVTEKTTVTVAVSMLFIDEEESPGLKQGGVLNIVRHQVEVVCAVGAIPENFTVSLEGLDIGDSVHISDVKLGEGVRPAIRDRDFTIATIAAPTIVAAVEEEAEAEEEGEETPEGEESEEEQASEEDK